LIGLTCILHRLDLNLVVLRVSAQPLDENDMALVINRHNKSVGIALDVKYYAITAYDARGRVPPRHVGGIAPLRILHFVKPRIQRRLDRFMIRSPTKGIRKIP